MEHRIAFLLVLLFALIAGLVSPAQARPIPVSAMRYADEAHSITLFDTACTSEAVLGHIPPMFRQHFRSGAAVLEGKTYGFCWVVPVDQPVVVLVYEDGDQGMLPLAAFSRAEGI